ncbi:MAG: zinc metallopeptidase [Flavobacteriales bacterium]|jgi:Zn-dependent membrane protease YugP
MELFYLIGIGFALLGMLVQSRLKSKFREYSQLTIGSGLTGREVAERMLADHGITHVKVISVPGQLTDHYHPGNRTVNLSEDVYHGRSAASAAVAAHECGHAVQHATAYAWLQFRSSLVPVVSFASNILPWILMAGILLISRFPSLLLVAILLQAGVTLFTLVTLPVEYDASNRALAWIQSKGIARPNEYAAAKDALAWAARTYVVAALAAVGQLMYLILMYSRRR